MAGIFTFAAVDCDEAGNRALCAEFGIQGFPTVKLMKPVNGKLQPMGTPLLKILCIDEGRLYGSTHGKGTNGFCKGEYGESCRAVNRGQSLVLFRATGIPYPPALLESGLLIAE